MNTTTETPPAATKPTHSVNSTLAAVGESGTTPGPYVITVYNERGRLFYSRTGEGDDTSYTLVGEARDATVFDDAAEADRVRLSLKETQEDGESNVTSVDPKTLMVE